MEANFQNVLASNLRVGGVGGPAWNTARLTTTITMGNQRLAEREQPINFTLLANDRYKLIIGMDILKTCKANIDAATDVLRWKDNKGEKVSLKLTPRSTIFRTKVFKNYRDYVRKIRTPTAQTAAVEVEDDHDDFSICAIEEEEQAYLGPELT